ncbi:hypothetical protein H072_7353 [Dactylellina haptotyla CBS 200.50]|uniref:G-patch domain-containing protein n=1 Tax=Dactylellina haptotyla (strain CBS 200.50) TaxID=1284197 RepID=S8BHZ3_DACHA|nr:hypothetical protein H072_7353 [Dactylellina haptotyla CBS 200.50]
MTMPSTAPAARIKPSRAFADTNADDDEDAFSRLASSRPKPASKLPPVEPKSLARPPTMVPRTTGPVPLPAPATQDKQDEEEEEDDYMSMTVADPTANETSLQRLKRRKLEASVRGQPMSKAELAEQERYKRDIGLATSILTNTNSKGLKMMKAMGFTTGSSLGKAAPTPAAAAAAGESSSSSSPTTAQKDTRPTEPIRPVIRESRTGIGHESDLKRKFSEFNTEEAASAVAKRQDVSPESYRNRLTLEAQQRRHEAQLFAAQSICEKLVTEDPPASYDERNRKKDENGDAEKERNGKTSLEHDHHHSNAKEDFFTGNPTFTQIKQINLIYRGLLYRRALSDLTKKLRKRETENLSSSKYAGVGSLPAYNSTGEFSVDDRFALGKDTEEEDVPDEEWEDEELEQFEKREVKDRLDEIVRYLRSQWRYCFWCKFRYATDEEMERDCPGLKEEDHD